MKRIVIYFVEKWLAMVSCVTFSPTVTEKGSRSRHWFPVGDEKVAEREGSPWLGE